MTNERLREIEKRAQKATKGPWECDSYSKVIADVDSERYDRLEDTMPPRADVTTDNAGYWKWYHARRAMLDVSPFICFGEAMVGDTCNGRQAADLSFIASSRQDVPDLCAALREAWLEIERLKPDADCDAIERGNRERWASMTDAERESFRKARR